MKIIATLSVFLLFLTTQLFSQNNQINIPFLEEMPVIDGLPGSENNTSWSDFALTEKSKPENNVVPVKYRMAYNQKYLYLIIEARCDSITFRDRAYQNGDGFHLVIAKPGYDSTTDEYYVLRFSPGKNQLSKKSIWYYNIGLSGKSLSSYTQFVCRSINGKSYFELLLSWSDVYPYHPLFSENIGINLCFVKAFGNREKNYHFLKYDENIQSELSKRKYMVINFLPSGKIKHASTVAILPKRNIVAGENALIKIATSAPAPEKVSYSFSVRSADDFVYSSIFKEKELTAGISKNEFSIPTEKLAAGGYKVVWRCSDNSEGEIALTVLQEIDYNKEVKALDSLKSGISGGDYNTMLFILQNLVRMLKDLRDYETAGKIREHFREYHEIKEKLATDHNFLSERIGIFRRAFSSVIDTTLQPYTVKIPVNFDRKKKYPLYVILHGSGSDDRDMLNDDLPLTNGEFIEIAPYGRGTSNCFTADGAQTDVKEAIEDAIANFPVDTSKIIIAGFSMGGYGALRIFYEYPHLFKGIALFSGHPDLANKWMGSGYPDFLNMLYLKNFKDIPIFIYHSKNDMNCPYELTDLLSKRLTDAGAKVNFVSTDAGGHGIIDRENVHLYYKWLSEVIR